MCKQRQLIFAAAATVTICCILLQQSAMAQSPSTPETALNNLYDNLLQREYAGAVVFPSHQVERKAQRSPSLRLRFGRRSDPDVMLMPSAEKRWFGDVNQKPIRSPSLRLRFGKRNNVYDGLLQDLTESEEYAVDDNDDAVNGYERILRKSMPRLRFGRSSPMENENAVEEQQNQQSDDLFNMWLSSDKLRNMLRQYKAATSNNNNNINELNDSFEFEREVRKPVRLRWGRSTAFEMPITENAHADADDAAEQQQQQQNVTIKKQPHATLQKELTSERAQMQGNI